MARILPDDASGRDAAIAALREGGVVALPTDTVYGIAVALGTPAGIEPLFAVKGRPPDKAIALLLADHAQALAIGQMTAAANALAAAFWPGGLTLVVRRRPDADLPALHLRADAPADAQATVGIRLPDHPAPRALAAALGPLPTTSANASGQPELRDAEEIQASLGPALAVILDGGRAHGGPASTVVDVTRERPRILRVGAVSESAVERALTEAGLPGVGR